MLWVQGSLPGGQLAVQWLCARNIGWRCLVLRQKDFLMSEEKCRDGVSGFTLLLLTLLSPFFLFVVVVCSLGSDMSLY